MAKTKNLPARFPAPRTVHYPASLAPRQELLIVTPAQLAARRREQHLAYARWAKRQAAIAEHDRKVRRFWLGFGAAVGTALLAAVAVGGWLLYHAASGLGLLAVPLVLVVLAGLAVGGHRCITIVQHWH